jgi:hypothetical protein
MRNLLLKRRVSGCPVHRRIDEMIDLMGAPFLLAGPR